FSLSNKHIHVFPDFPLLRKNTIPNAGMYREQRFESISKRAARCIHFHVTKPAGHGPQWPRYPEIDSHRRLLFRPDARESLRLATLLFAIFEEARLRFSIGLGVEWPESSATTAVATQTICGRPLNNSFQDLPASLEAYNFPLRVPK